MSSYLAWARVAGQVAFAVALAAYGAGCSSSAESPDAPAESGGSASVAGNGGMGGAAQPAPILTLSAEIEQGKWITPGPDATIVREPHQPTQIQVHASDGERTVRFALLPNDLPVASGDSTPGDAALDQTEVLTDLAGYAIVWLTAPSSPTTFLVRASAGTLASDQLRFSVEQMNLAKLEVVPLYAGSRPTQNWTASATPDKTCSELTGTPPEDGYYSASAPGNVLLSNLPVGVPLAVTVRADEFAWGCASLAGAVESGTPERVEIVVTDVQIRLDQSEVELVLSLDSLDGLRSTLAEPLATVKQAVRGDAEDDVEALLDAMQDSLGASDAVSFSSTRESERWDLRVREALGEGAASMLSEPLARWLDEGLADLEGAGAFSGVLAASEAAAGSAELTLESVFGLSPEDSGFKVVSPGPWYAEADNVLIGMTLEFEPAAFVVAAARAPAIEELDDATSIEDVLEAAVPCSTVIDALVEYDDCGGDCKAERVCRDGLELIVERAAAAETSSATLAIAASGEASVGPTATLRDLRGSWIGKLELDAETVDVGGSASATSTE
jgi:hypothetical protein